MHFKILIVIVSLLLCKIGALDILRTRANLEIEDSVSVVSIQTFQQYPGLTDAFYSQTESCFDSHLVTVGNKKLLIHAYENFYASFANVYPGFVIYDISNNTIIEKSRISVPFNNMHGIAVSPSNELKYVAQLLARPAAIFLTGPAAAFTTNLYNINLYPYDQNGIFALTSSATLDMATLHPAFYKSTVAYNGLAAISNDGKYILATYATGASLFISSVTGGIRDSGTHSSHSSSISCKTSANILQIQLDTSSK